jgi:hypothetical protein
MPTYCGKPVSDAYLQSLIAAYRRGYSGEDANEPADDATVIARLEAEKVVVPVDAPPAAFDLGAQDAESD